MKKVFYGIVVLILLYFVLGFFGPKTVKTERTITINASPGLLKEKLGDFQYFHESWSPWTDLDPNMKTAYTGVPGQPGHHYEWSGNEEVGSGSMTLVRYNGDSLVQALSIEDAGDAQAYLIVNGKDQACDVTWGMVFNVGFMKRTPLIFISMDETLGKQYEEGLMRLKQSVEGEELENRSAAL